MPNAPTNLSTSSAFQISSQLQLHTRNTDERQQRYYGTFARPVRDQTRISLASSVSDTEDIAVQVLHNNDSILKNGMSVLLTNGSNASAASSSTTTNGASQGKNGHNGAISNGVLKPHQDLNGAAQDPPIHETQTAEQQKHHRIATDNGGYAHTDESRAKISAANRGKTPWNKGKAHSDELKRRISEGVKARNRQNLIKKVEAMGLTIEEYEAQKKEEKRLREADRRKRKTASGGYSLTDETKQKISKSLKEKWAKGEVKIRDPSTYFRGDGVTGVRQGHGHSEATKEKISQTLKAKWENVRTFVPVGMVYVIGLITILTVA
jgi:hypothetical protein